MVLFGGIGIIAAAIGELGELAARLRPSEAYVESARSGIQRYSRHPLYLGITVAALGIALAGQSGLGLAIGGLLAIAFLIWVPTWERAEERRLGADYRSYRERTPLLLGIRKG